jgi:hypothetical protein
MDGMARQAHQRARLFYLSLGCQLAQGSVKQAPPGFAQASLQAAQAALQLFARHPQAQRVGFMIAFDFGSRLLQVAPPETG